MNDGPLRGEARTAAATDASSATAASIATPAPAIASADATTHSTDPGLYPSAFT